MNPTKKVTWSQVCEIFVHPFFWYDYHGDRSRGIPSTCWSTQCGLGYVTSSRPTCTKICKIWCRWWITEWCIMRDVGWWMMNSKYRAMLSARCKVCLKKLKDVQAKHPCCFACKWWFFPQKAQVLCARAHGYRQRLLLHLHLCGAVARSSTALDTGGGVQCWQLRSINVWSTCSQLWNSSKGVASMLLATNSTYEPPSVVFFLGKGVIRQW